MKRKFLLLSTVISIAPINYGATTDSLEQSSSFNCVDVEPVRDDVVRSTAVSDQNLSTVVTPYAPQSNISRIRQKELALLFQAIAASEQFKDKDVTFLVGSSRSGKGTLINWLLGTDYMSGEHDSIPEEKHRQGLIPCPGSIERAGTSEKSESHTLLPTLIENYGDVAGFEDTRGDIEKLCANVGLELAIRNARSMKLVVVLPQSGLGGTCSELKTVAKILSQILSIAKSPEDQPLPLLLLINKADAKFTTKKLNTRLDSVIKDLNEKYSKLHDEAKNSPLDNVESDLSVLRETIKLLTILKKSSDDKKIIVQPEIDPDDDKSAQMSEKSREELKEAIKGLKEITLLEPSFGYDESRRKFNDTLYEEAIHFTNIIHDAQNQNMSIDQLDVISDALNNTIIKYDEVIQKHRAERSLTSEQHLEKRQKLEYDNERKLQEYSEKTEADLREERVAIERYQESINNSEKNLESDIRTLEKLKKLRDELESQITSSYPSNFRTKDNAAYAKVSEAIENHARAEKELNDILILYRDIKDKLEKAKNKEKELSDKLTAKRKTKTTTTSKIATLKSQLVTQEEEKQALENALQSAKNKIATSQKELENHNKNISDLDSSEEVLFETMTFFESRTRVIWLYSASWSEHTFEYSGNPFTLAKNANNNSGEFEKVTYNPGQGKYKYKYTSHRNYDGDAEVTIYGQKRNAPGNPPLITEAKEKKQKSEAEIRKLDDEIKKITTQLNTVREKIKLSNLEIASVTSQLDDTIKLCEESEETHKKSSNNVEEKTKELNEVESKKNDVVALKAEEERKLSAELSKWKDGASSELDKLIVEIEQKENIINQLTHQISRDKSILSNLESRVRELDESKPKRLSDQIQILLESVKDLDDNHTNYQIKIEDLEKRYQNRKINLEEFLTVVQEKKRVYEKQKKLYEDSVSDRRILTTFVSKLKLQEEIFRLFIFAEESRESKSQNFEVLETSIEMEPLVDPFFFSCEFHAANYFEVLEWDKELRQKGRQLTCPECRAEGTVVDPLSVYQSEKIKTYLDTIKSFSQLIS